MTLSANDSRRSALWSCGHVYTVKAPDFQASDVNWCRSHTCPDCNRKRIHEQRFYVTVNAGSVVGSIVIGSRLTREEAILLKIEWDDFLTSKNVSMAVSVQEIN